MNNNQKEFSYSFLIQDTCNMCNSDRSSHLVLGKRMNLSQGKNPRKKYGISTTVQRCKKCGLIFSNPLPIPKNIQDHYGILPEEYWSNAYISLNDDHFKQEILQLKNIFEIKAGMKSLDIGAGLGKTMIALDSIGFESYGFEPSEQFYNRALSNLKNLKNNLKLGMLEDMEYPENSFDFINFGAVLEHLYRPSEAIIKSLQWLKPHGIIHIEVPSSNWLINKWVNLFYFFKGTDYVANLSPMHEPFHLYEFNHKTFEIHANKNNYSIIKYDYFVCQTFLPYLINIIIKPYMRYTNKGMQLSVWLKKN